MTICIIPARGGSSRIPGKNWKDFHGKPIIQYSIETAEKSGLFDQIYVSTDSQNIYDIAVKMGVKGLFRSKQLSQDDVGTQEVVTSVLEGITRNTDPANDYVCCLYATSPLLSVQDLKRGLSILASNRTMHYSFSVGVNPLHDAGNFYFGKAHAFLNETPIHDQHTIMVPIDESRVQDINTPEDWDKAKEKYARLNN